MIGFYTIFISSEKLGTIILKNFTTVTKLIFMLNTAIVIEIIESSICEYGANECSERM